MRISRLFIFSLFFIIIFSFHFSNAQSYKFQTTGFSLLEKNEKGKWTNWSDLELVTIPITLDTSKHRIVIYTSILQLYSILSYGEVEESKTDTTYSFECKDYNGEACTILIITRKQQGNRKQLYINYNNRILLYNI